jgi:hypothetical protein
VPLFADEEVVSRFENYAARLAPGHEIHRSGNMGNQKLQNYAQTLPAETQTRRFMMRRSLIIATDVRAA